MAPYRKTFAYKPCQLIHKIGILLVLLLLSLLLLLLLLLLLMLQLKPRHNANLAEQACNKPATSAR